MTQILLAAIVFIQSSNGTVAGRVLSASGVPAVGVRVTARSVADAAAPASPEVLVSIVQTDSAGRYRFENVPPGRYYISAGLVGSPTYFPGTAVLGDAKAIDITSGSTASVPDFTIQQASVRPAPPAPVIAQDLRFRLLPKLADPVSLDVVQDAQASFEAIGKIAGVRVLFDRRFVPGGPVPFRAQSVNVFGALNLLSSQSGNTWTILGRDTIVVVPSNFGITNLDLQLPARNVSDAAVYPGFRPNTGPLSFEIKSQSRDAFETIATAAGLTVVFDRDFRASPTVQLKIENADIYSALDAVSVSAGAFWWPYDSKTIFVSLDNTTKHNDYDLRVVKTYYLSNLKTPQEINIAADLVRRQLSPRAWFSVPMTNAIVIVDNPSTIALADKLIQDLDKTPVLRADAEMMDTAGSLSVLEPLGPRNVTPYRSELQPRAGLFSLDTSLPTRQAYEKFAESAGIRVVFDPNLTNFTPSPLQLKLNNVDFFKALDLLSLQTVTFWIPLDSKTIFVASNNSVNHRDYDPQIVKAFYLNVTSTQEVFDTMNIVRQVVNGPLMTANTRANALVIRDNPRNMALAEMLIEQLNKDKSKAVRASAEVETYSTSNTFIRDFSGRHTLTPVRSLLQPAVASPISLQMNENARATFEALAQAAGLQIMFDSRFVPGGPVAFHVDDANGFDALSILSYQTKTFWRVVDSKTIQVAPATNAIRNELEPKIQKSVPLINVQSPQHINDIVNTIRQTLLIQTVVAPNAAMNAIEINETAEKVAVAEALIRALDVP